MTKGKKGIFLKSKKILKRILIIFILLFLFLASIFYIYSKKDIAAQVFNEKIYKAQVEAAVNRKINEYEKDNIKLSNADINSIRKQILNDMIEELLLDKYANDKGITVTEEEIKNEINLMRQYTGLSEDNIYKQALSKYQLLESDINEMVRSAILADKIYYTIIKDINISDEELWEYFKVRVKFYSGSVRLSHIFIPVNSQEDTIEEIDKKYKKMQDIRNEILNGLKFEDAVKKYSEDPSTKEKGGDLFWFRPGTLNDSELSKAAFSLNINEISQVLKSQYGFHILKVTDKITKNLEKINDEKELKKEFEKIKEIVKYDAFYQKAEEKIKDFNKSLWDIYKNGIKIGNPWDRIVNILNNFLKKLEG